MEMMLTKVLFDQYDIEDAIEDLADHIHEDLAHTNPIVLTVLTGGMVFAADLIRKLDFPLELDYCKVSSYIEQDRSGLVLWLCEPFLDLSGRTIVIVDDIFDTGHTMVAVKEYCMNHGASDVKIVTLLNKVSKNEVELKPDYNAYEIEDHWVYGYGMDNSGYDRNLPDIMCKVPIE